MENNLYSINHWISITIKLIISIFLFFFNDGRWGTDSPASLDCTSTQTQNFSLSCLPVLGSFCSCGSMQLVFHRMLGIMGIISVWSQASVSNRLVIAASGQSRVPCVIQGHCRIQEYFYPNLACYLSHCLSPLRIRTDHLTAVTCDIIPMLS